MRNNPLFLLSLFVLFICSMAAAKPSKDRYLKEQAVEAENFLETVKKQADLLAAATAAELDYVKAGPFGRKDKQTHRDQITIYCEKLVSAVKKLKSIVNTQNLVLVNSSECANFEKQRKAAELDEKSIYNYGFYEYSIEKLNKAAQTIIANKLEVRRVKDLITLRSHKNNIQTNDWRKEYVSLIVAPRSCTVEASSGNR